MKTLNRYFRHVYTLLLGSLLSVLAFAQDKGVDINVDVGKKDNWYQQPWVWIVGGAVFILLLVALLRGGGKKEA